MRTTKLCVVGAVLVLAAACTDPIDVSQLAADEFAATLTGGAEVPPVITGAGGAARFTVTLDTFLSFRLDVSTIDSTTLAHIHEGTAGATGGILVTLFTGVPACTTTAQQATPRCRAAYTGLLNQGQLRPSQLTQLPVTFGATPRERFDSLVALMRAGGAYVNVHTRANPDGHVRGPIQLP